MSTVVRFYDYNLLVHSTVREKLPHLLFLKDFALYSQDNRWVDVGFFSLSRLVRFSGTISYF